MESVLIQENIAHNFLNSKAEYTICAIPRLTSKLGDQAYKRWEKEDGEERMRICKDFIKENTKKAGRQER